jgi:mycofactocin precursor
MTVTTTEESVTAPAVDQVPPAGPVVAPQAGDAALVERDQLVEDVSIDGMCGVY